MPPRLQGLIPILLTTTVAAFAKRQKLNALDFATNLSGFVANTAGTATSFRRFHASQTDCQRRN
jgi:hypothetical protein